MKIGYIGGVRDGKNREFLTGHNKYTLDWEVKAPRPSNAVPQGGFQTAVLIDISPSDDTYKLNLLKKDGEFKFFYVLEGTGKVEIITKLEAFWGLSDIVGYDFD